MVVSSFSKHNAMLDFKCYLVRKFLDKFQLRHAKQFLEIIDKMTFAKDKTNIFVINLNPVKCACLLIEILDGVSYRFHQL